MVEWPISPALEVLHLSGGCKNEGIGPKIKKGQEKQWFLSTKYQRLSIWMVEGLFKWQNIFHAGKFYQIQKEKNLKVLYWSFHLHLSQLTDSSRFTTYQPCFFSFLQSNLLMDKLINDANCFPGTQADDIMPSEQARGTKKFLSSAHVHIIYIHI